jgi:hypothetical protein
MERRRERRGKGEDRLVLWMLSKVEETSTASRGSFLKERVTPRCLEMTRLTTPLFPFNHSEEVEEKAFMPR